MQTLWQREGEKWFFFVLFDKVFLDSFSKFFDKKYKHKSKKNKNPSYSKRLHFITNFSSNRLIFILVPYHVLAPTTRFLPYFSFFNFPFRFFPIFFGPSPRVSSLISPHNLYHSRHDLVSLLEHPSSATYLAQIYKTAYYSDKGWVFYSRRTKKPARRPKPHIIKSNLRNLSQSIDIS